MKLKVAGVNFLTKLLVVLKVESYINKIIINLINIACLERK